MYRYELTWEIAFLLAKDDWEYGFSPLYRWGAGKGRRDVVQAGGVSAGEEVSGLAHASLLLLLTRVLIFSSQGFRGVLRTLCQRHSGEALVCGCLGVFEHERSPPYKRLNAYDWVWVLVPPRWRVASVGTCSSMLLSPWTLDQHAGHLVCLLTRSAPPALGSVTLFLLHPRPHPLADPPATFL